MVYDALGLTAGGSNSFGNLSAGDVANGFAAPISFNLLFAVDGSLTAGLPFSFSLSGVNGGSYVIAYDCNQRSLPITSACSTPGDVGQTPFTNAGLGGTALQYLHRHRWRFLALRWPDSVWSVDVVGFPKETEVLKLAAGRPHPALLRKTMLQRVLRKKIMTRCSPRDDVSPAISLSHQRTAGLARNGFESRRDPQLALRMRLKDLAAVHVRSG